MRLGRRPVFSEADILLRGMERQGRVDFSLSAYEPQLRGTGHSVHGLVMSRLLLVIEQTPLAR
jgi:hypothetical protein